MSPVLLIVVVVILIVVALLVVGAGRRKPGDSLQARLAEYSTRETPSTLEEIELSLPFSERVITPLIQRAAGLAGRFSPAKTLESTRHKLDLAGNPNNWTPSQFFGLRVVAAIALGGLVSVLMLIAKTEALQEIGFTALFAVLGFMLPALWLGSKIATAKPPSSDPCRMLWIR